MNRLHDTRRQRLLDLIEEVAQGNKGLFADKMGRKRPQIYRLFSDAESARGIGEELARDFERQCGKPHGWLDGLVDDGGTRLLNNTSPGPDMRGKVPLISWVQAGHFAEAVDLFQPGDAEEWLATTATVGPHTYALRVRGDSMEDRFPEGTILIVEPNREPVSGNFVIAKDGDDCTFKQFVKDGSDWYLKPLNTRYPIKLFTERMHLCGVVISSQQNLV